MPNRSQTEPTFAVATLGCKVNQADSEAISEQMNAAGFMQRNFEDAADVYIVNTCTVTHLGDRSSRQMISQTRRRHPGALLVVTGCYAEVNPRAVAALPGVDLVVGNTGKDSLAAVIKEQWTTTNPDRNDNAGNDENVGAQCIAPTHHSRLDALHVLNVLSIPLDTQHIGSDRALTSDDSAEPQSDNPAPLSPFAASSDNHTLHARTRVQMKVQDGCDNRCTYCIVPTVRGKSRSRSTASIVDHVQRKARAGYKEVVLTGIHLGDYHPDSDEKLDLGDLIAALLQETEMPRIRVSSLEPEDFRLEWLELWQDPRMCRHLHLPMQSGSDAILRRMARRYTSERYRTIITTAQRLVPGIAISTDIITGFPGETDDDFERTYQLASELRFAKSHVFRFSPRQGTAAARMKGQIKDDVKKARSERLLRLNDEHSRLFRQQFLGEMVTVLLEARKHGRWEGLTDNYLRVEVDDLPDADTRDWQNTLVSVRLLRLVDDGVFGTLIR